METDAISIGGLVEEYRTLCYPYTEGSGNVPWNRIESRLVQEGEWTPAGAVHLANLARRYGSFVLRNALALALALDVEDGEVGL